MATRGTKSAGRRGAASRTKDGPRRSVKSKTTKAKASDSRKGVPRASRRGSSKVAGEKTGSFGRRLADTAKAVRTVGARRLSKGALLVGSTARITPTKRGLKALGRSLRAVQKATKLRDDPALYTFELEVRFRGLGGKREKRTVDPSNFPQPRAIKSLLRRAKSPKATGYVKSFEGLSERAAFEKLTEDKIMGAVDRTVKGAEHSGAIRQRYEELRARIKGKSPQAARRAINAFKRQRGLSFKVRVRREVT